MNRKARNPRFWSPTRCAERWDVALSTVSGWMQDGTIPPEAIKRIGGTKRIDLKLCEEIWDRKRPVGRPASLKIGLT